MWYFLPSYYDPLFTRLCIEHSTNIHLTLSKLFPKSMKRKFKFPSKNTLGIDVVNVGGSRAETNLLFDNQAFMVLFNASTNILSYYLHIPPIIALIASVLFPNLNDHGNNVVFSGLTGRWNCQLYRNCRGCKERVPWRTVKSIIFSS